MRTIYSRRDLHCWRGLCRQSSVTRCDPNGEGVICEVSAGMGEVERCDGADNDCDGLIDEDYPI